MADVCEKTGVSWVLSREEIEILEERGQYYAAGFMEGSDTTPPMRFAHAIANFLTKCAFQPYDGELLYPANGVIWKTPGEAQSLWQFYVHLGRDKKAAEELLSRASAPAEKAAFTKVLRCINEYPQGGGYTHSIVNFGRVLEEGLDSYKTRIEPHLSITADQEKQGLYKALLIIIDAIDLYRERMADYLASLSFDDPGKEKNRLRLVEAYRSRLPMRPASGFFEAMVSTIFIYAIDGSDNLGRFDQFMRPYYEKDLADGKITREEAVELVRTLWKYVDDCFGWNVAIGGTTPSGEEASSDLTLVCMEAARSRRRPNLALRLREDTPEKVWDAALDVIITGNGLPALYCEELYLKAMDEAQLNLPDEDKRDYAFGGCTELMIHGCSNVGSLDDHCHVIGVLESTIYEKLASCATFEEFLSVYEQALREDVYNVTSRVNRRQEIRSVWEPLLLRTLLIDDCIDRGRNYSNGGARYNWSVILMVGLSNAIDSLIALKKAVYEEKKVSAEEMIAALRDNYVGYEDLRAYLEQCPRFGNDDAEVNELASRLSGFVYKEFKRYAPWRGGKFLASVLMFTTYADFGKPVGATLDGRLAGTPVADSAGPVQGRDRKGPTAMLRSTASLQQIHAPGTLVVNMRVSKKMFSSASQRAKLKSLIRTYFKLGGMQLQVNVVDQEILKDAIAHPEKHRDLIIRIGGYSEYFNNLSEALKLSVLERTEHE